MNNHGITKAHIEEARKAGSVKFAPGCWLTLGAELAIEQKDLDEGDESKDTDFSESEFWITTDDGQTFVFDADTAIDIFGRINANGDVDVFNADGSPCTRWPTSKYMYDVNSGKGTAYEHPNGITISQEDAEYHDLTIES